MAARDEPPWTAGAYVYSGRPDPTWTVTAEVAEQLTALHDRLSPRSSAPAVKSVLGYRGCWLERSGGPRLMARDGAVVTETSDASASVRAGASGNGAARVTPVHCSEVEP
jgi:hypothetical protein